MTSQKVCWLWTTKIYLVLTETNSSQLKPLLPLPLLKKLLFCLLIVRSLARIYYQQYPFFIIKMCRLTQWICQHILSMAPRPLICSASPDWKVKAGALHNTQNFYVHMSHLDVFAPCPFYVLLCYVIYRLPQCSSGFIQDFSDQLSVIMSHYGKGLSVSNFNINVCCTSSSNCTCFH